MVTQSLPFKWLMCRHSITSGILNIVSKIKHAFFFLCTSAADSNVQTHYSFIVISSSKQRATAFSNNVARNHNLFGIRFLVQPSTETWTKSDTMCLFQCGTISFWHPVVVLKVHFDHRKPCSSSPLLVTGFHFTIVFVE